MEPYHMTLPLAILLTFSAALWRWADGRGWPAKTTVRNLIGLLVALFAAYLGLGLSWQAGVCALLAWATLILGYTNWPSWWSVARYGGPTCVIAAVGWVGGAPLLSCALYGSAGLLVGLLYVVLHKHAPFRYSTAVCEAAAGATIVGGLSWFG